MAKVRRLHKKSILAQVLTEIFKNSGFTNKQWAKIYKVTPQMVGRWMTDRSFPSPQILSGIISWSESTTFVSDDLRIQIKQMLEEPAIKVTPHWHKVGGTIGKYILKPRRDAVMGILAGLHPTHQKRVMDNFNEITDQIFREERGETRLPGKIQLVTTRNPR